MYQALAVANYFVQKSFDTGVKMTPMKAIKLVYLAHGWHLVIVGKPLIAEAVQAWTYGPMVESVYEAFKHYRDSQITELALVHGEYIVASGTLLDRIWKTHGHLSGNQLSNLTSGICERAVGALVSKELIENYFIEVYK